MCLQDVYDINKMPKYKEAYKIFCKNIDRSVSGLCYDFNFKKRKWLKDTNKYDILYLSGDGKTYPCGFHCYINKKHVLNRIKNTCTPTPNCVIHRVLVRNIVAWGIQSKEPESLAVIAREIFIMGEVYEN